MDMLRSFYGKTYATSCMTTGHSRVEHRIHLHLLDLSTATHYRICKINGFNQSHSIHIYGMMYIYIYKYVYILTYHSCRFLLIYRNRSSHGWYRGWPAQSHQPIGFKQSRSLKLRTFPNMTPWLKAASACSRC